MIEPGERRAVVAVFLAAAALFFASPVRQVSDSYYSLLLAQQIATRGTLDLAEHFTGELPLDRYPGNRFEGLPYQVRRRGGAVLTEFPLGAPILAAPWMGAASALGRGVLDADGRYDRERERRHQRVLAALASALFVAGAFVAARRRLSRRAALWTVAALAVATPVWSTASRGWWSHTAALLLLGLALPLAVRRRGDPPVARAALLGALLAGAYVCRPTAALALGLAGLSLAVADRRAALRLTLGALPVLAGLVLVSWTSWGTLLPPYYLSSRLGWPTAVRLAGVLVSPSRGLFVFEPALAVALAYGALRWRRLEGRPLFGLGAAGLALHAVALAGFPHWWGGHGYGPRLFTETVAYQALVAVPVVATLVAAGVADRRWRRALVATVALGVVLHAGGALSNQGNRWNWSPVGVDEHPERLWDWSDPQGFAWANRRARSASPPEPSSEVEGWGQLNSHLEPHDGGLLLAANWAGRSRPYRFDGRGCLPLVAAVAEPALATVDLYAPTPLGSRHLLLAGTDEGRWEHDLYALDLADGSVANLTASPQVDDGAACVSPAGDLASWSGGDRQRFARFRDGRLDALPSEPFPSLQACLFLSEEAMVGYGGRLGERFSARCDAGPDGWTCRRGAALDGAIDATRLFRLPGGEAALVVLDAASPFRRFAALSGDAERLGPMDDPWALPGDRLELVGGVARIGHWSRYVATAAPDADGVVFRLARLAGRLYGVVADATRPRSLAVLEDGAWRPLCEPPDAPVAGASRPRERWFGATSTADGHQAFEWGPQESERVVLWLHGGPRENVSPRYHPYFRELARRGWRVVALNYPGSTGRGWGYERLWDDDAAAVDALRVAVEALRADGASTIVSWSISSGARLQSLLLGAGIGIDGMIDQAGFDNRGLIRRARRARVPLFAIRGRHDRFGRETVVDHYYADGHDVTMRDQFVELLAAVDPFLEAVAAGRPWRPADAEKGEQR